MFAKIRHNKKIRNTLYYHEKKERQRLAECLTAVNFVKDLEHLTHKDMLHHFQQLTSLHETITHNGLHVSLSFHPTDKLSNKDMINIAEQYMQEIKFGDQPYLVYRHYDTIHPHVHLVTTNIQYDGERLNLSKTDYYHSLQLTRTIENERKLTLSGEWRRHKHTIGHAAKIKYGEMATMTAMNNVLEKVIPLYKYTSMDELNAVLRLYNVEAYKGREDSRLHQRHGLIYRVLREDSRPVGRHIKASLFDSKPTLKRLEQEFASHQVEAQRQKHRQRVTAALEWNMAKKNMDLPGLRKALEQERISMVWMERKIENAQNIFYVDHETRAVFDGRQLGERYDAAVLRQRLVPTVVQEERQVLQHRQRHHHKLKYDL